MLAPRRPLARGTRPAAREPYLGDGYDILLQGFHWGSHAGATEKDGTRKSWYRILKENADVIRSAGFTRVWFPPPSDSLAPQGYIPRRWNVLDSAYGSEAELRAAIAALAPVQAVADVVLNHRVGVATGGADFADPPFPDNRAAVARDDESGVGTGNPDTGERHPAGRDLDHTNAGVRQAVKEYLGRLKAVGFTGWRYDLAKGYHGRFVAEYNDATQPAFSVGEYFDADRQRVTDWVDAAQGKSAAFDFPTRYALFDACDSGDFSRLRSEMNGKAAPAGLIGFWPSRAVTFVDNHDTECRRERELQEHYDSTRHFAGPKALMAYAYLLTHPGVPCVYWPHYFDWGHEMRQGIDDLMKVRRFAGLHATSPLTIKAAEPGVYAAVTDDRVAVKLGPRDWSPGRGWDLIVSGEGFAVWVQE